MKARDASVIDLVADITAFQVEFCKWTPHSLKSLRRRATAAAKELCRRENILATEDDVRQMLGE